MWFYYCYIGIIEQKTETTIKGSLVVNKGILSLLVECSCKHSKFRVYSN